MMLNIALKCTLHSSAKEMQNRKFRLFCRLPWIGELWVIHHFKTCQKMWADLTPAGSHDPDPGMRVSLRKPFCILLLMSTKILQTQEAGGKGNGNL